MPPFQALSLTRGAGAPQGEYARLFLSLPAHLCHNLLVFSGQHLASCPAFQGLKCFFTLCSYFHPWPPGLGKYRLCFTRERLP